MTAQDASDLSAVAQPIAGPSSSRADSSLLSSVITATNTNLSKLTKTVVATSASLTNPYGDITNTAHYRAAMTDMGPTMRKPAMQRRLFSFRAGGARVSRGGVDDLTSNALLSKEMLADLPDARLAFSLLQGFKATLPEHSGEDARQLVRSSKSKSKDPDPDPDQELTGVQRLEKDKKDAIRKLQRLDIRKAIVNQAISEINARIEQLSMIREKNLERLAKYEDQELELEDKLQVLDYRIELLQEDDQEDEREELQSETNVSGAADTESISVLALGESQYSAGSYRSDDEGEERQNYHYVRMSPRAAEAEQDEDDEAFAQEMTASMREAWVSSFLEWEKLSGE